MRRFTVPVASVLAALLLAMPGPGAGCSSTEEGAPPPQQETPSAPLAGGEAAQTPAAAPTVPVVSPAPTAAKNEGGAAPLPATNPSATSPTATNAPAAAPAAGPAAAPTAAPTSVPAASGAKDGIIPSTRRSSAGLPEPLPDYTSWCPLRPCAAPPGDAASAHLVARKAYAFHPKGEEVKAPFPAGVILLLEEKDPATDFISRLAVMTRAEDGWKFSAHARHGGAEAFAPASASQCEACHSKAKESVFSPGPAE
jgi:hypothetical protein